MKTGGFRSTRWTLVQRVSAHDESGARALSELCEIYYEPVRKFIFGVSRCGERADDLTQAFFAHLLEKRCLGDPDQQKGRFRSYLLISVKRFLRDQWQRETAAKRGGGVSNVLFDESLGDGGDDPKVFDREWAKALILEAMEAVRVEMASRGKERQFELLRPWLDGRAAGDADQVAEKLGLNANAFKVAVHRLRERFRRAVREEISATVNGAGEVEDEFRYLIDVLVIAGE